jgi:hypothetical protein
MKNLPIIFIIFLSINSYSQINFEKGYYINNSNEKIECLIKNMDWNNNPVEFEYKLLEDTDIKNKKIKSVQEFGLNNLSKYIRREVKIDRSKLNTNNLSKERKPIFEVEELFLKVLIEGKSNLYEYVDGNLRRYFYSLDNSEIDQLVFKKFITKNNNLGQNNTYKQQLWSNLKCTDFKISRIENLTYNKNDLIKFFVEYNECHNHNFINYKSNKKKDLFNLTIRPRINNSSLEVNNNNSFIGKIIFDNENSFGLGIEAEYILPFNKNKWSIAIEPTFQNYKSKKTSNSSEISGGIITGNAKYSSIEIPLSLRHFFYINNDSKIFLNASLIFDLSLKSSLEFTRSNNSNIKSLDIESRNNFALGAGYKLYDRYSLEVRYQTNREILGDYIFWGSKYSTLSVIFGYTLF